jgi:hypothetical protein
MNNELIKPIDGKEYCLNGLKYSRYYLKPHTDRCRYNYSTYIGRYV